MCTTLRRIINIPVIVHMMVNRRSMLPALNIYYIIYINNIQAETLSSPLEITIIKQKMST